MRPAVQGNARHIPLDIETIGTEHAIKVTDNISFKIAKGHFHKLRPPRPVLVLGWQARRPGGIPGGDQYRLIGFLGVLISAQTHGEIEPEILEKDVPG